MKRSAVLRGMRLILLTVLPSSAYALSYSGTILDCSGKPASGTVVLHEMYGADGLPRTRSACTQPLDGAGRFTCGRMAPGRYAVVVLAVVPDASSENQLASPLLPRETREDGLLHVNDESQRQKHALHVCASEASAAAVVIPDKPPASYLNLAFATSEGDLPTGVTPVYDPETGKVLMPALGPGNYHLQAYWFANGANKRFDRVLRIPEDIQTELALEQTLYRVTGSVRSEGGMSLPATLNVIASCGQFGSMVRRIRAVAGDGSFTFGRLDAPACSFSIAGVEGMSILSMEANESPALYGQALLKPYPAVNRLDLTVTTGRGSLSGHVEAKGSVAGSGVVACGLGSGECQTTKAGADGTFHFSALAAGPYQVSSWPALDQVEYRVPAFMRQFVSSNGEVQLKGSQAVEVSVTLNRPY